MRNERTTLVWLTVGLVACLFVGGSNTLSVAADSGHKIAIRDDCDPTDPAWNATGGCALEDGAVTNAEFGVELGFPVSKSLSVIGHQAWRNDPPYLKIKAGKEVTVRNRGGRTHTFTEVAEFGAGRVPNPALNKGLSAIPECPGSTDIRSGEKVTLSGLTPGNHRFQCCIHPWMRAIVKVQPKDDEDEDEDDN